VIVNQIPISVEYFIQERLGHELRYTMNRSPFFLPDEDIRDSVLYRRGYSIDLKQKFYSRFKEERGMLYFGHEVRFSNINYLVKSDTSRVLSTLNQKKAEYAITIGDRVLGDIKHGGITLDFYLGLGVAYVFNKWDVAEGMKYKYLNFNDKVQLNPRIGFSLGYLF
jgi:hypothetical protein